MVVPRYMCTGLLEDGVDRAGRVAHVVPADLARAVGQPVRELGRGRVQQQARALDRIAGDADDPRLLHLLLAVLVGIEHAGDLAGVRRAGSAAPGAAAAARACRSRSPLRNLGVERRPFGARLAALETEADLLAGRPVVARLAVDRHPAGMDLLVAEPLGAGVQHLEVVVAGQARDAVGPRHAHLVLGLGVVGLELGQGHRPVEQIGARRSRRRWSWP